MHTRPSADWRTRASSPFVSPILCPCPGGRSRKYSEITPAGRRALRESTAALARMIDGLRAGHRTVTDPRPPRLAEWLARHAGPPADAAFVAGDMREEFDHRVASLGGKRRGAGIGSAALRSCLPLVVRRFTSPAPSPITSQPNDAMWMSILADARARALSRPQEQARLVRRYRDDGARHRIHDGRCSAR